MFTIAELLTNVYGGALVGVVLTSLMFGIISVQTYKYFENFPRDFYYVKIMVAVLWIFQAFEVICTTKALYWYLATHPGNYALLITAVWEGTTYQTVSTAASVTTQTFFVYRVYQLSHSVALGLFLEVLVLIQCTLGAITAAKAYIYANFAEIAAKEQWIVFAWLAAEAIADTAIATSMVLLLRRQRNGFEKTDGMINTLVIYSINTGAATSFLAIGTAIVFALKPFHFVIMALAPPLGALYTICMMANLHSRTAIRRRYFASTQQVSIPMKAVPSPASSRSKQSSFSLGSSRVCRIDHSFDILPPHAPRAFPPQPAITCVNPPPSPSPFPKTGVHVHIQKQSVADASPPQTFQLQPRHALKIFWDEEPVPRAI